MKNNIYSKKDLFYREFEERFRGSRDLITSRLLAYTPFLIKVIEAHGESSPAIDLGCGRGEWLELLQKYKFNCYGVDLDDGMLKGCLEMNLPADNKDALQALSELPPGSQSIVSGFHIAEHLPFEILMSLVSEAHRVLKPAGLLILETPNPENLRVGSNSFYLDPSHERPIPSSLLAFLAEFSGFKRVKVIGLQEDNNIYTHPSKLLDVLTGVSPDYAIIAQKNAIPEQTALFDSIFAQNFGIGLEELASSFQEHFETRISKLEYKYDDKASSLSKLLRHSKKFFQNFLSRKSTSKK